MTLPSKSKSMMAMSIAIVSLIGSSVALLSPYRLNENQMLLIKVLMIGTPLLAVAAILMSASTTSERIKRIKGNNQLLQDYPQRAVTALMWTAFIVSIVALAIWASNSGTHATRPNISNENDAVNGQGPTMGN